jgi:hypothetical protein
MQLFAGLLILASAVGGLDVAYFHIYRFRLASRAPSRAETVAHLAQGATFMLIIAAALVAPASRGLILTLCAAHFASMGADVMLEKASRADLGGVPTTEYLLHVAGATATGGAAAAYFAGGPSELPDWQRVLLVAAIVAGTLTSALETVLLSRGRVDSEPGKGLTRGARA